MLRVLLLILILAVAVTCSKNKPAPIAPASKITSTADASQEPTNLRIEALTDTSARVAWDAVDGATDYDVNYKKAQGGRWTNEPHRGTRLWNIIYDLEPGTEYRWAVRAENKDGPSEWVFADNFTTMEQIQEGQSSLFNIELLFADNVPELDRELFRQAAKEWERVILQGKKDIVLPQTLLNVTPVVYKGREIDDLLVLVNRPPPTPYGAPTFGFSAFAQVHYTREDGIPALGQITYEDEARDHIARLYQARVSDFNAMNEANGWGLEGYMPQELFEDQIIQTMAVHEIGHLLGLGTMQAWFDLIKHSSHFDPPQPPKVYRNSIQQFDFFFTGEYALRGYRQIHEALANYYGSSDHAFLYQGTAIPMDEEKHHWAGIYETSLDVMGSTRVLQRGGIAKPYISALTLGALTDLGYDVDRVAAVYKADWNWGDWITLSQPAAAKSIARSPIFVCRVGQE